MPISKKRKKKISRTMRLVIGWRVAPGANCMPPNHFVDFHAPELLSRTQLPSRVTSE